MPTFNLLSPDGEAYTTSSAVEATRLKSAHGYVDALPAEANRPIAPAQEVTPTHHERPTHE